MQLDEIQRAAQEQFARQSQRYGRGHILENVEDITAALQRMSLLPGARALDIAFHCLCQSAFLLNEHLNTGFQDRLGALADRYKADNAVILAGGTPVFDDPAP